MKDVGEIIMEKRLETGLSQAQLADRMRPPCTRQAIKKWEEGAGDNIGLPYLRGLARVFKCSIIDFIDDSPAHTQHQRVPDTAEEAELKTLQSLWFQLTRSQRDDYLAEIASAAASNAKLLAELQEMERNTRQRPNSPGISYGGAEEEQRTKVTDQWHKKAG